MVEGIASSIFIGSEMVRDKADNIMTNPFRVPHEQFTPTPQGQIENWAYNHIGDVAEVSLLFSATRVALAGANEALRRTTGKEISDEACFWASMAVGVTIPSLIELNVINLSSSLSPMSDKADLFGVGVAAVGIAAAHYAGKYREPIAKLAASIVKGGIENGKIVVSKLKEANNRMDEFFGVSDKKSN